jgi:hypothetical protein
MAKHPEWLEQQAEEFAQMCKAMRMKLGRKLTPKEALEVMHQFLDGKRAKKNGSSLSKNPPHAH